MTSTPTATRFSSPLLALMAGWVCAQAACSLGNLDYLKSGGDRLDGAPDGGQETGASSPDMASRDGVHLDLDSAGLGRLDGSDLDGPIVVDTRGEIENNQSMDAATPDMPPFDGAQPDASVLDVPANPDSPNSGKLDALLGADAASGGNTGTADVGTAQGGAGAGGNTATGGKGGTATGGSTGTGGAGGTSLRDGGADKDAAATGDANLTDGGEGEDTASVEVGMDVGTDTATCSGVPHAGICWYLGPQGNSCQQVCTSHGIPAPNAASHVGTAAQGGSNAECKVLLGLLGISGTPDDGTRTDGLGLGCHLYSATPWWLKSPNFAASASQVNSRLVCGCTM